MDKNRKADNVSTDKDAVKSGQGSISFDPAFDTPSVLRSYGGAFTGRESKETFSHWEFAATPQKDLAKVEQYFDLGVTTASDKTLSHSLSTMVVGSDGKVVAWYPNNEWTPQAVEDVMRKPSLEFDLENKEATGTLQHPIQ